jgi:hypothetical protein
LSSSTRTIVALSLSHRSLRRWQGPFISSLPAVCIDWTCRRSRSCSASQNGALVATNLSLPWTQRTACQPSQQNRGRDIQLRPTSDVPARTTTNRQAFETDVSHLGSLACHHTDSHGRHRDGAGPGQKAQYPCHPS